jgi:uncharacterized protein YyaL (SSP411 family)
VAWHHWNSATLQQACLQNRPLLVSMGYTTCPGWALMHAEAFADPGIAARLNSAYVSVRVDRDQYPALEHLFQLCHQLLLGQPGGWPLTLLVDPEAGLPFFVGGYFPLESRAGVPGFAALLDDAARHFAAHRGAIRAQTARLKQVLLTLNPPPLEAAASLDQTPLLAARQQLAQHFDRAAGGFDLTPSFPVPEVASFLLRHWNSTAATSEPDLQALYMATLTLTQAADWPAAPFEGEQTLLDHARRLRAYSRAAAATGEPLFRLAAEQSVAFVLGELNSPDGRYFTALLRGGGTVLRDPQCLTAANALWLQAWGEAARWLDRPDWADGAHALLQALLKTAPVGEAAGLEAQAHLLASLLSTLTLEWRSEWLTLATGLADTLLREYADHERGGFYSTTALLSEPLPRLKPFADGTLPAGNGVVAQALFRLSQLTGEPRYRQAALRTLRAAWPALSAAPLMHLALLDALADQTEGLETIIIRGPTADGRQWSAALARWVAPARQVYAIPATAVGLPPFLAKLGTNDANMTDTTAYIVTLVEGATSAVPEQTTVQVATLEQLARQLRDRLRR